VVPHIASELLFHKQVALPTGLAIPDHQPPMSSVYKPTNAKTYPNRKLACMLARCKAQCAPLCPSLVPGWVAARSGFSS
jgi:hypothetical protein